MEADAIDENDSKESNILEELGLIQAEERLKKDCIYPLTKKVHHFPSAKYICRLCSFHLDSVPLAHKHIKHKNHKKLMKKKNEDDQLKNLAMPPADSMQAINDLLINQVLSDVVLDHDDMQIRNRLVDDVAAVIHNDIPECKLELYGSSLTGFGFKTSDVNIDMQFPKSCSGPQILIKTHEVLKESERFKDVESMFMAKCPYVQAIDTITGLKLHLSTGNELAVLTSKLLLLYAAVDPKVLQLTMVFRSWARICRLDRPQDGSIVPHAYALMSIYFLQQKKYISVIDEILSEAVMDEILKKTTRTPTYTRQGSDLYLSVNFRSSSKPGNSSSSSEEKSSDEGGNTSSSTPSPPPPSTNGFSLPINIVLFKNTNLANQQLAEFWLKMLKFYALEFDMENLIVSVRSNRQVTRDDKKWSKKRIAVLDPFLEKRNLCSSLTSQVVFSYLLERLRDGVIYFYRHDPSAKQQQPRKNGIIKPKTSAADASSTSSSTIDSYAINMIQEMLDDVLHISTTKKATTPVETSSSEVTTTNGINNSHSNKPHFEFTADALTDGTLPVTVCGFCKNEGHTRDECPDEVQRLEIPPLPPLSNKQRMVLDSVCNYVFKQSAPSKAEERERGLVCDLLATFLRHYYDSNITMHLFGSSHNGFGFRGSDLDICLVFDNIEDSQSLDFLKIIEEISTVLKKNKELKQIIPITTAKVPIIKFEHRATQLEGDISLYNILAQRNTAMLACYADIDSRCRKLGYAMKTLVKMCSIGDASRGSLSSYAYILLVIFYLQQRSTPVLPVLQELDNGDKKKEHIVDGWNSWFYDDIQNLKKVVWLRQEQ